MVESNFVGDILSPHNFAVKMSKENSDKYALMHFEEVSGIEDPLMVSAYFYHKNNSSELIRTIEEITSDRVHFLFFDDDNRLNSYSDGVSSPCFEIVNMDWKLPKWLILLRNRKKGTSTFKV